MAEQILVVEDETALRETLGYNLIQAFTTSGEQRGGILVEYGTTEQIFTRPNDARTEAYITGRFG